jgi:hypothetical protein
MGNEVGAPQIPPYSPRSFVSRGPQIAWIKSQIQKLLEGEEPEARAIEFWGPRGSGKSWLLQHLACERYPSPGETGEQLAFDDRVHSLYLDLDHFSRPGLTPEQGIENLMRSVTERLAIWRGQPPPEGASEDATLTVQSDHLVDHAKRLVESDVLVLLLDHVSERKPEFLRPLESRVLAPLARLPRVLLVMSKRGKGYPWQEGVLRWNVRDCDLDFFDVEGTSQQLNQLGLGDLDAYEIWQQSHGCPLSNYFLVQEDGLRQAADALLVGVLPPDRERMEALCVLRFVLEDHFPLMLAAYHNEPRLCSQDEEQTRDQLQRLLDLGFLRWDRKVDGFVLDIAIRPLVEQWLLHSRTELWRRLQCEAYALYADWQGREPRSARRWIEEAAYHGERLQREGFELYDCFPSRCYEERYRSQPEGPSRASGDLRAAPSGRDVGLTGLNNLLAELYPTEELARQIVSQAGLPSDRIAFSAAAKANWHSILEMASVRGQVSDLVSVAREDHPEWVNALSQAEKAYYRLIGVLPDEDTRAAQGAPDRQDPAQVQSIVSSTQPNLQAIRGLLRDAFIDDELWRFCYDRSLFRRICSLVNSGAGKDEVIDKVVQYCESRLLFAELLTEIRAANPRQYERYAPYLYGSGGLPQDFVTG